MFRVIDKATGADVTNDYNWYIKTNGHLYHQCKGSDGSLFKTDTDKYEYLICRFWGR